MLVLLFISAAASDSCMNYQCSTDSDVCSKEEDGTVYLYPCSPPETCLIYEDYDAQCVTTKDPLSYPGDYCDLDSDCTSGKCVDLVCIGQSAGQSCVNEYDCNPGLYCESALQECIKLEPDGSACNSDYDCSNRSLCINSFCTPYLSQPIGTISQCTEKYGIALACTTGYAFDEGGICACALPPVSNSTGYTACEIGTDCYAQDGVRSKPCMCAYDDTAESFCPLFPGDPQFQAALNSLPKLLKENENCNTVSRLSADCFLPRNDTDLTEAYYTYKINYGLVAEDWYPRIYNNSFCVKSSISLEYWELYLGSQPESCPVYECAEDLVNGTCDVSRRDVFDGNYVDLHSLKSCATNYTCASGVCHKTETKKRYPGDYCLRNHECISDYCFMNRCLGPHLGDVCKEVYDCSPGLYCNTKTNTCQQNLGINQACNSTYECQPNLICSNTLCIQYATVPVGGSVSPSNEPFGLNLACETGYAEIQANNDTKCAYPPVSMNTFPYECVPGSVCYSNSTKVTANCTCGLNSFGASFCPVFPGDLPLQEALLSMQQLVMFNSVCNTASRFSEACFLFQKQAYYDYYTYAVGMQSFYNYSQYIANPYCVKETYNQDFWYNVAMAERYSPSDNDDNDDQDDYDWAVMLAASCWVLIS
mmetsp:Transcript_9811/g.19306  ORF Transcript_9811/g.19306 Transcript_9811/m.19306 type:complete len:648 (+) Transcript_9811:1672-3615(+)